MKVAILTSGGDAPGMNAFIRAVVNKGHELGVEVYGIERGYTGMINGLIERLRLEDVSGIIHRGGTILKTARSPKFYTKKGREKAAHELSKLGVEGLICCGGDGSYAGLKALAGSDGQWHGQVIGVPGTIDNDIKGTDYTIGFDTAINTAVEAIDKLRDTGDSHNRHFIVEVMGRFCGDIAQAVGTASGARHILIPETPSKIKEILESLTQEGHNIIVVAEGDELGGAHKLATKLNKACKDKTITDRYGRKFKFGENFRVSILGHIQRGGSPTARDRVLATQMGEYALESLLKGKTLKSVGIINKELVLMDI